MVLIFGNAKKEECIKKLVFLETVELKRMVIENSLMFVKVSIC